MQFTKLIFGLHNPWDDVTISISGRRDAPAPDLTITDGTTTTTVAWDAATATWSKKVPTGDYLFTIEIDDSAWFNGVLTVTVVDRPDVTFVVHGPETTTPNMHQTLAWTATSTSTSNDPKDPWPPPGAVTTTLPTGSQTWHDNHLHAAALNVVGPKGEIAKAG